MLVVLRDLTPTPEAAARWWAKVNTEGPWSERCESRCWDWTAYCDKKGYGQFSLRGKGVKAHRFALALHGVTFNLQHTIDHRCRRTCCVNPAHLEPVTDSENNRRRQHAIQDELDLYAEAWQAANEGAA